jgi:hypothetical protein
MLQIDREIGMTEKLSYHARGAKAPTGAFGHERHE